MPRKTPATAVPDATEELENNISSQESQTDTELTEMQEAAPGIQPEGDEMASTPQTETETTEFLVGKTGQQASQEENAPDSQTDTETTEFLVDKTGQQAGQEENTPDSQTGSGDDANLADTKDNNRTAGSDCADKNSAISNDDASPHTETDADNDDPGNASQPEDQTDLSAESQTESENAASGSGSEIKRPRKRSKKSESGETADNSKQPDVDNVNPPKPIRRRKKAAPVLAIDEQRSVETEEDKLKNDLLDLVESLKGKKILAGTIQGVERSTDNPNLSFAVIYHGAFKVIIPAEEAVDPPKDFRDRSPADVMHYLLTKRLGAEVDFIVKGVDAKTGIAAASRLEAMAQKRRQYYFGTDRDGNNLIYEGLSAEARVISVIRAGIFIDLFGLEAYIPLVELSYQRWIDAAAHIQPGQRVLVKILKLDRTDRDNIRVSASVKQAGENPYEQALKRYSPGCRYVGTVSVVDTNGVFVSLEGGIDCLCSYPKRGRPPRGSRVTVKIIGVNHENNRIWGAITHMTTTR